MAAALLCSLEHRPELLPRVVEAVLENDPQVVAAAARVLELRVSEAPYDVLRQAETALRSRSRGFFNGLPAEARAACRSALAAIQAVTARVSDLPVPAQPSESGAELPRPSAPPQARTEELPIPGEDRSG